MVITAHNEGRLLRPTLRSVASALECVVDAGNTAELLIVCDSADDVVLSEARRWCTLSDLGYDVRMIEVALGESGASRNAGAYEAQGEYVAFVDGDDLVSSNYLDDALRLLRASDAPTIIHPEYVVSFGARSLLWRTESTRTHDVSYRDLIRHNLWPSSAVTRRDVYLDHPYRTLPPEKGYGPEDWVWNIDTSAAGVVHDVAPDTVFFYRVREQGGVNSRHSVSILPVFDFEGLKRHLPIPGTQPGSSSSPDRRSFPQRAYAILLPFARWSTRWLSFEAKHGIYRAARGVMRTVTGSGKRATNRVRPAVAAALSAAAEIDPAVSWTAHSFQKLPIWLARDDGYAECLEAALDQLDRRGGALVAVPWIGVGGADIVSLNYAKALAGTDRFRDRTTILGTFLPERTVRELIPESINYVHLDSRWLELAPHIRRRLIAQLIVLVRPELLVSVNCFHVTEALQDHHGQILDGTRAYATLFAFDRIGEGYPVNPITDDSQRTYLDAIDGLLTDNSTTEMLIEEILALPPERVLVHRQPAMDETPALNRDTNAYRDDRFSDMAPFTLVWPHRLDDEKRPDVVVALSRELRRRQIPARIEVWGQRVLTPAGTSLLRDLKEAGAIYRGPYSGGLASLDTNRYHALLLTSKSEGLPLVLVQSLLLGLPAIASRVGGVPDIIVHETTGLLTNGPDDIAGYADAVERLMADIEFRRELIENGYAFAVSHHSWAAFARTVGDTFATDLR